MRVFLPSLILIGFILGCNNSAPRSGPSAPSPTATPVPGYADLQARGKKLLAEYEKNRDDSQSGELFNTAQLLVAAEKPPNEQSPAAALAEKLNKAGKVVAKDEADRGDKPEIGFEGKVLIVDRYLRTALNDYDSSEYVSWTAMSRFHDSKGAYWVVGLKLRAKNGFGAYVLRDTFYFIQKGQVVRTKGLRAD